MIQKILVVNVNWLGDVIFSTPVFKNLKAHFPEARVYCLAVPRVREILESCPFVDDIIVYDEKGRDRGPLAKLRLILRLRKERFDIAFLLHRSWTRALLVFLAGIPQRVGYNTKNRGLFLTHRIEPLEGDLHKSDYYLGVIEGYGILVGDRTCELAVSPQAQGDMERLLAQEKISGQERLIVVNSGGNWDLKRWPRENFGRLVKALAENLKGKVVLPGGAKDLALAQEIGRASGVKPVILAGKTNLKQLIALMARAELVISADSGPLHMANSVGVPVIAIFGPTRPETTGPRGKGKAIILQKDVGCNQAVCYNLTCPDNVCMRAVLVEDVLAAVRRVLF